MARRSSVTITADGAVGTIHDVRKLDIIVSGTADGWSLQLQQDLNNDPDNPDWIDLADHVYTAGDNKVIETINPYGYQWVVSGFASEQPKAVLNGINHG